MSGLKKAMTAAAIAAVVCSGFAHPIARSDTEFAAPNGVALGPTPTQGGFTAIMLWGADKPWGVPAALQLERSVAGEEDYEPWGVLPLTGAVPSSDEAAIGPIATIAPRPPIRVNARTTYTTRAWIPPLDPRYTYRVSTCGAVRFEERVFPLPDGTWSLPSPTSRSRWLRLLRGVGMVAIQSEGAWRPVSTGSRSDVIRVTGRGGKVTYGVLPTVLPCPLVSRR